MVVIHVDGGETNFMLCTGQSPRLLDARCGAHYCSLNALLSVGAVLFTRHVSLRLPQKICGERSLLARPSVSVRFQARAMSARMGTERDAFCKRIPRCSAVQPSQALPYVPRPVPVE